jgi:type I restriction enzyme M protein
MSKFQELSSLIWNVADDVLRGLFKPHEYGDVILPFVILRRLDCVIEPRKDEVYFQLDKPAEKLHKNNRLFLLIPGENPDSIKLGSSLIL